MVARQIHTYVNHREMIDERDGRYRQTDRRLIGKRDGWMDEGQIGR